jgi:hypothetical protein
MKASNPRKRLAITDLERQNIRRRYATHPSTQPALIAWYAAQPQGRNLTQGQISSVLSEKYQYLDSDTRKKTQLGSKRNYNGEHPELEAALFEWQQCMQNKKAIITGDILKTKAHEL